jgi:hypothetical protein
MIPSVCVGFWGRVSGMGWKKQISVFGLFWEYVSAMNHCGIWILLDHRNQDCVSFASGALGLERRNR